MKRVFSNRNVLVISTTNSLVMFFDMLYWPYWAKYLEDVADMSIPQIGVLSAIQRSEQLLFQLPGGILADRIGRKKVTLIAAVARMIVPIIYLSSKSFEFLILGTLFTAMNSLRMPASTAMIAESLPRDQMGSGYGVFNMVRRVPMLFTGILGGMLMDALGIEAGTRICFMGSLIGAVIAFTACYIFLTETLRRKTGVNASVVQDFKEVLPLFKGSLQAMQVTSAIYQFASGLTMQLIILYVIDHIGFSYTQWGLISTTMSIVGFLTSIPGGMMADKYDRVKLNVFARALAPITTIAYITLRDFYQILATRIVAGVGMGLSGAELGWLGGASWDSLMADIVPSEKRGRVTGLMGTVSGSVSLPSPYIGAYMWDNPSIGPEKTMGTTVILGLFSTFILWRYVKDPRSQKQKIEEKARDDEEGKERS